MQERSCFELKVWHLGHSCRMAATSMFHADELTVITSERLSCVFSSKKTGTRAVKISSFPVEVLDLLETYGRASSVN